MSGFLILMDFKGCKWKVYLLGLEVTWEKKIVFEIKGLVFHKYLCLFSKKGKNIKGGVKGAQW